MNLEQELVKIEMERLELLFEESKYNNRQKRRFIESKLLDAKNYNDKILLKVCEKLINKINEEEKIIDIDIS